MPILQRVTTQYDRTEDRFKLIGEIENDSTIALWLTQRIFRQVLSHLLDLVAKRDPGLTKVVDASVPASSLIQEFAQQAASANLKRERPVKADTDESWLIQEVDISINKESALVLVFRRGSGKDNVKGRASLKLSPKQLRQWLGIVHSQWRRAEWPLELWPTWMDTPPTPGDTSSLH